MISILEELLIINPSTISDDLFVGRVPELAQKPFHQLKKLTFEAEKLPSHVAKFILSESVQLNELVLILDELLLDNFKGMH